MKELTFSSSSSFILCCVRWPDMAVIQIGVPGSNEKEKVLLPSLDAAHNLSDIFQIPLTHKPQRLVPGLLGAEIDQELLIKQYLAETQNELKRTYSYLTAFNLEGYFSILKYSPGLEEYALLMAFEMLLKKYNTYDYLIFDMPPTALALKFFNLPFLSTNWIDQLEKLRTKIREKREIIDRIQPGQQKSKGDKVLHRIKKMNERYQATAKIFQDKTTTSINVVLNPNELAISETRRVHDELEKNSIFLNQIIWNKMKDPNNHMENSDPLRSGNPSFSDLLLRASKASVLRLAPSPTPLTGVTALNTFLAEHHLTGMNFSTLP